MQFLSGNEAIAQGAWEAGAHIGVAYPGTPSTEAMEAFSAKDGVYAEWCPNEKVALEVGAGASAAGARVLATMKHVGVNVAADPLFTLAYTGVGGSFVIVAADDPGMHSSQNEQDSRFYALSARIPMLEPSDSAEARLFTASAFELSEAYDLPFMIRSSVRISHGKSLVECGTRKEVGFKDYAKDAAKWIMMPAFAQQRRRDLDERIEQLKIWVEECEFNRIEHNSPDKGFICSGAAYQYVREACPDASIFKLGCVWPLPEQKLKEFAASVTEVYVIDEASDYLSMMVRSLGIMPNTLPQPLPQDGELSTQLIQKALGMEVPLGKIPATRIPNRPPALCPGCPHRLVFKELSRMRAIVTGDIGCYTLGALPPLSAMDICIDMGASISMAHGFELAFKAREHQPVVAVIGDSTFAHSGITSLMNTVYNKGVGTVCILDNRTTAMTGRQGNPFNGETLQGRSAREMDIEKVVRALGIDEVRIVNPHVAKEVRAALKEACASEQITVLIFRAPCILLERSTNEIYEVSAQCTGCSVCVSIGCPALSKDPEAGFAFIDPTLCVGCGQCEQYCNFGAIVKTTS